MTGTVEGVARELGDRLKRDRDGLVCAVVQDHRNGEVLMVGWMDDVALARTLREGRVTFWSRSRKEYWRKGDTSGNTQHLIEARLDCDGDALLLQVEQKGPACHTGTRSCFDAGGLITQSDLRDAQGTEPKSGSGNQEGTNDGS